jgi:hypothetical protein
VNGCGVPSNGRKYRQEWSLTGSSAPEEGGM